MAHGQQNKLAFHQLDYCTRSNWWQKRTWHSNFIMPLLRRCSFGRHSAQDCSRKHCSRQATNLGPHWHRLTQQPVSTKRSAKFLKGFSTPEKALTLTSALCGWLWRSPPRSSRTGSAVLEVSRLFGIQIGIIRNTSTINILRTTVGIVSTWHQIPGLLFRLIFCEANYLLMRRRTTQSRLGSRRPHPQRCATPWAEPPAAYRRLVHKRWRWCAPIISSRPGRRVWQEWVVPPVLGRWQSFDRLKPFWPPPPTTRHRSPASRSAYFVSFSALALCQTMPSSREAPGLGFPLHVSAPRRVMSSASWFPRNNRGLPCAVRRGAEFISQSRRFNRTMACDSRPAPGKVLSGVTALVRSRPECGQAPLCLKAASTSTSPISRCGEVLAPLWTLGLCTSHETRWRILSQRETADGLVFSGGRRGYCQPCAQSPGSSMYAGGGRAPSINPVQPGRAANPCRSSLSATSLKFSNTLSCFSGTLHTVCDAVGRSRSPLTDHHQCVNNSFSGLNLSLAAQSGSWMPMLKRRSINGTPSSPPPLRHSSALHLAKVDLTNSNRPWNSGTSRNFLIQKFWRTRSYAPMPSIDRTVHSGQRRSSPASHSPRNQCLPWLTRRTEILHKLLQQLSRIDAPESWPLASATTCLLQFRELRRRASSKLSRWQSWRLWWQVRVLSPGRGPRVHETTNWSAPCRPSTLSAFRTCTIQA